ncbi:GDSL-type esterase/lipase family protein [Uliginosibacterium sp. TH139]|uniref:GDSL-type esterase/lipase family protein n=1 Tax=Uliginosibacterium sp. TH139 TaxID=2067453 RepID=UPI000C7A2705|nr:GDSL-type esterase/lipase family protein [Uliginosibacterium sp. TH139]PLK48565.1 hypothetical protein C0V76_10900 [Uliginosibacterium sp. TH139]
MITRRTLLALSISAACVGLAGCATSGLDNRPELAGVVAVGGPLAHARVSIVDAKGLRRNVQADSRGRYELDPSGLTAPLLISAIEAGNNSNCRYNATLRARCLASVLTELSPGRNIANINPLTDRIVSDVAVGLNYYGPQQLVDAGKAADITPAAVAAAKKTSLEGFAAALKAAGVSEVERFDAVTTPMQANGKGLDAVLEVVNHNRNYHNPSSESAYTVLTDISFRPIVGLNGSGPYEALDFKRAQQELAAIKAAKVRVLVVGDSTAATYELERMPRMGWGQVFEANFRPEASVKVLNAARAGRSSKDFYMGGWYQQMARFMQPGDLVLINHGHNDQNCDGSKKERGAADVAGLCSYPNDAQGRPQFPSGKPEMSFQNSLLRYVDMARAAGATPVFLTPTTRVWNKDRKPGFPVVPQHLTTQNSAQGFAFVGDYSQTVKDAARASGVPLIDLEAKTISFANAHQQDWQNYWLAIGDFKAWPWYATQSAGTAKNPDTTHFQQGGAEAVAALVAQGLKETPALNSYAVLLK